MTGRSQRSSTPWYKERWPWLLMVPPLVAIVVGFYTLKLAIQSWDGLVSDDYYKEGLTIQKRIDRTAKAAELGLAAWVHWQEGRLTLWFDRDRLRTTLPHLITVRFVHPTQNGKDQQLNLVLDDGRYWAPLPLPTMGRWHIVIEDESRQWRLSGTIQIPTEREELILPSVPNQQ